VDVYQIKLEFESSKEILLDTILKNRENLDMNLITVKIKDFLKNYEKYDVERERLLDVISKTKSNSINQYFRLVKTIIEYG
jgi:hypothetical protein